MLTIPGTKIKGTYNGHKFEGRIYEYHKGISTITLDTDLPNYHGDLKSGGDRFYFGYDPVTGKTTCDDRFHDVTDHIQEIEEHPGDELKLYPLGAYSRSFIDKKYKPLPRMEFIGQAVSRGTKYRSVTRTRTCEYGHKHRVEEREPVRPTFGTIETGIAYFFYTLALYVQYLEDLDYTMRVNNYHRICDPLVRGAGQFLYAGRETLAGLDPESVAGYLAGMDAIYWNLIDSILIHCFGSDARKIDRYLRQHTTTGERRARIMARLGQ